MTGARTLRRARRKYGRTRRRQRGGAVTSLEAWKAAVRAHLDTHPLADPVDFKSLVDPTLSLPALAEGMTEDLPAFEVNGLDIRRLGYSLRGNAAFAVANSTEYATALADMDDDLRDGFEKAVKELNDALEPTTPSTTDSTPIYAWYFVMNLPVGEGAPLGISSTDPSVPLIPS
jgi:hypothetical protein